MIYGYVRVSTTSQNISRQYEEMIKYGVEKKNIYVDKESGKDFNRKNYQRLLKRIKDNDLLIIKSIDRLGRNYNLIIEEWRNITQHKKANIKVIDMPLLDTSTNDGKLLGKFISDIVLQILSFVADNERENIRRRQREGIEIAKRKGIKFGRPLKKIDTKIIDSYKKGIISKNDVLSLSNISNSTFYRRIKDQI